MKETGRTLLDYYGPMFEAYHAEGCTCPTPQRLQVDTVSEDFYRDGSRVTFRRVRNRCSVCGLIIHAREIMCNENIS